MKHLALFQGKTPEQRFYILIYLSIRFLYLVDRPLTTKTALCSVVTL